MGTPEFPAHAELLDDLFAHVERRKRPSRFAPGATALDPRLLCPACSADLGTLPALKALTCTRCSLHLHIDGMSLRVWRDPLALVSAPAIAGEEVS